MWFQLAQTQAEAGVDAAVMWSHEWEASIRRAPDEGPSRATVHLTPESPQLHIDSSQVSSPISLEKLHFSVLYISSTKIQLIYRVKNFNFAVRFVRCLFWSYTAWPWAYWWRQWQWTITLMSCIVYTLFCYCFAFIFIFIILHCMYMDTYHVLTCIWTLILWTCTCIFVYLDDHYLSVYRVILCVFIAIYM